MSWLRYLWALPNGLLALPLVVLAAPWRPGHARVVDGVLEVHGAALGWLLRNATLIEGGAAAITFGHVVLGRDAESLSGSREHERVHVRQYERWGPLFLPAYLLASAWMWLTGRDPYRDNPFEREAYGSEEIEPGR